MGWEWDFTSNEFFSLLDGLSWKTLQETTKGNASFHYRVHCPEWRVLLLPFRFATTIKAIVLWGLIPAGLKLAWTVLTFLRGNDPWPRAWSILINNVAFFWGASGKLVLASTLLFENNDINDLHLVSVRPLHPLPQGSAVEAGYALRLCLWPTKYKNPQLSLHFGRPCFRGIPCTHQWFLIQQRKCILPCSLQKLGQRSWHLAYLAMNSLWLRCLFLLYCFLLYCVLLL